MGCHARLASHLQDAPPFDQPVGDRLVHQHVLALLHRGDGDRRMEMIGRHDLDGVQILLGVQQLAEIGIGGTCLEFVRAAFLGVVRIDHVTPNLAPPRTPFVSSRHEGSPRYVRIRLRTLCLPHST
jgi:hypothetical protein